MTEHQTSSRQPGESTRTYWLIFWTLIALLALTVIASFINLDRLLAGLNAAVALAIAAAKGSLVVLFFMHIRHSSKLTWIFASAAFVWLGIMLVLTFNDYITRL